MLETCGGYFKLEAIMTELIVRLNDSEIVDDLINRGVAGCPRTGVSRAAPHLGLDAGATMRLR